MVVSGTTGSVVCPCLSRGCTGEASWAICVSEMSKVVQGDRTSVVWASPKAATANSTSAGARQVGYCQPNFKKCDEVGKTFSQFLLKYFQTQNKCV